MTAEEYREQGYTAYNWIGSEWQNIANPDETHSGKIEIYGRDSQDTIKQAYVGGTISANGKRAVVANVEKVTPDAPGSDPSAVDLVVDGVSIVNNWVDQDCGCAIRTQNQFFNPNRPIITVRNCVIKDNQVGSIGGVIDNVGGKINLQSCTIVGNTNTGADLVGAAISNRYGKATLRIEDCFFYKNFSQEGGGALFNATNGGNDGYSLAYVKDSYFLTGGDNIYCESGSLVFQGTNYLGGSLTANLINGSSVLDYDAAIAFINHEKIEITLNCNGNNTLIFNNSEVVDVGDIIFADRVTRVVINPDGLVGEKKQLADNARGWSSPLENTVIEYAGETGTWATFKGRTDVYVDNYGNELWAKVTARGLIMNKTIGNEFIEYRHGKNVEFKEPESEGETYSEDIRTVHAGGEKLVHGNGKDTTFLYGRLYADGYNFDMSNLDYKGRIYGDGEYDANGTAKGGTVTLSDMKIESDGGTYSRIYGGADITASNVTLTGTQDITLNISLLSGSTVGNVYGGGCLSQTGCTYNIGNITTTIGGDGYFRYYVGNGTQANSDCTVTQGNSTLNIYGGTFASFVYAGGYNQSTQQGATSIQCGTTTLNISGGTFLSNVFGGCVASDDVDNSKWTTVNGDCIVTVNATGSNKVVFGRNLIAGSNGTGDVTGSTYLIFTGSGSNVTFAGANRDDVEYGYIQGGCSGDKAWATSTSSVDGTRNLVFDGFSGDFGANVRNMLETVTFKNGSSVTLTGPREVDLRFVNTWNFDLRDTAADLNWTSAGCLDAENNFAGDKLVIDGTPDTTGKVLMNGDDVTLNGWQKIASLEIGGTTYLNDTPAAAASVDSVTFGNTYRLSVSSGALTLASIN